MAHAIGGSSPDGHRHQATKKDEIEVLWVRDARTREKQSSIEDELGGAAETQEEPKPKPTEKAPRGSSR